MTAFVPPQNHRNASEAIYNGQVLRDASKKGPQYSVFGDTITGSKLDEVTVSFQVGVSSYDTISAATGGGAVTSIYDIAATSVSGGTLVFPIKLGKTGSQSIDMSDYIMLSLPGETLSFTAFSSGASAIGIGCRWLDKF